MRQTLRASAVRTRLATVACVVAAGGGLVACGGSSDASQTILTVPLTGSPKPHVDVVATLVTEYVARMAKVGEGGRRPR